ncbi:uncharacterized protein LOC129804065 [Phlebotomus papatasi]|uniref:uncharacterized protein LOC129804065 n=1 Tax=Phlebotomus papatasi TaxID=29031 RepID=UPI002484576E|nr:uncharacterized protein LOC129804065 [Phlebotomus papatasi]
MEAPKTPASPSLSGGGIRRPNRPRITITIPPNHQQSPFRYSPYGPSTATTMPPTAMTSDANLRKPSFFDPFGTDHPAKYGDFMSKQFEGIKDFTKLGLGHGEKVALWVYEKFSSWSKKWFTHIFLVIVVLLYSLAGAYIFKAVEGKFV